MAKSTSKRHSKNGSRKQSPLSRVLSSSQHRHIVLARFFTNLSCGEIRASVGTLASHRHFKDAISLTVDTIDRFYAVTTPSVSLDKNIAWCLGLINHHADLIRFFIQKERLLLRHLLAENIQGVLTVLDEIDQECGLSTWSISLRCSTLSMAKMADAKRDYLTALNERAGGNNFLKSVIQNISSRYEDIDLRSQESKYFEQKIKRTFSGQLLHFLMYKLAQNEYDFEYDFEHILNVEKSSSVIDLFKCLIDFVVASKLTTVDIERNHEAINLLRVLNSQFDYPPLKGLANSAGLGARWDFDPTDFAVLDSYTSGQYDDVCRQIEFLPDCLERFALFAVLAKAMARLTTKTTAGITQDILQATISLLQKNSRYDESVSYLTAVCHSFSMLPWFRELHIFVTKESRYISTHVSNRLSELSAILSEVDSPLKAAVLPTLMRADYLAALNAAVPDSLVAKMFETINALNSRVILPTDFQDVDPLRAQKYLAKWFFDSGDYPAAIRILVDLQQAGDIVIAHEASRLLVKAYIAARQFEDAASTYVHSVIANPHLMRTFDSAAICEACTLIVSKSRSLSVSIALSLHSRFVDDQYDAALKYSFECYLVNNGHNSPVDVFPLVTLNDKELLYFLEYVCVPDVMKLYLYFESSKAIETCRIDVCKFLIAAGHSVDQMVTEVKKRARRLVLIDATMHVEHSRIYSDMSTLFRTPTNDYRIMFERFAVLRSNDYSGEDDEQALSDFYIKCKDVTEVTDVIYSVHIQNLILNEKNALFLKLIKMSRDEFTFGDKGLSGHLSTRIRHGHFPKALRKCVADEGLVTSKSTSTGAFKKNAFWTDKYSFLNPVSLSEMDKALSEFSSKYDSLVNEVNDQWLQIYTLDQDISGLTTTAIEDAKIRLFNYSTSWIEAYFIQSDLPQDSDFSAFVKLINHWLWKRTESNLNNIRARISTDVRDRAYRLLDALENEVIAIIGYNSSISEFSDAVGRARSSLTASIETISSWFTKPREGSIVSFDSELAFTIASLSAGANVKHTDVSGLKFQGAALTYLVDVLYVLVENCVTKSNLSKELLQIETVLERLDNDKVNITIKNNCVPIDDLARENSHLQFYRDTYGKEDVALKAAQGEGRSGFFKIWKALFKDLELPHEISFGYTSVDEFCVCISLDERDLNKVLYYEKNPDC